jgi:hypothetical protein
MSATVQEIMNRNHLWNDEGQHYMPLAISWRGHKNVKLGWGHLKIFSRTTGLILARLGTKHPWVKGIQVCSKEGDSPFPRGDNSKRVKIN